MKTWSEDGSPTAFGVVGGLRKAFPLRARPLREPLGKPRASQGFYTPSMTDIAALRKSYERAELDESASAADPMQQFGSWLEQAIAAQLPEPNAMTLATVGAEGRPSTRIVLVKGFDERGIVWFTNYQSRKGRELAIHPFAALQFHWVELERVVRIEGRVEKVSAEESDAYFASRPLDSRIGAWASPQSQVISGRGVLVANAAKFGAQFMLKPPRPPHWIASTRCLTRRCRAVRRALWSRNGRARWVTRPSFSKQDTVPAFPSTTRI